MEPSHSSKIAETELESGCCSSAKDRFKMTNCKENLPTCDDTKDHDEEVSDEEYSDAKDESIDEEDEELEMTEEEITEKHKELTEDELQKLKAEAADLKNSGNELFKKAEYKDAIDLYTRALNVCPLSFQSDRSVLYANRAASRISLDKKEEAILDCSKAIELNPDYLKAVLRRAQVYRKMDNLERSLEDYKKVMELDPNSSEARQACATMPQEINEKNEKLKAEMFGKLKDLGNMCLKPFGLSTENFKMVQDPNTGGYSVNFQNNPS